MQGHVRLANEQLYRDLGIFIIHEPSANQTFVKMCPGPLTTGSEEEGLGDPGYSLLAFYPITGERGCPFFGCYSFHSD